MKAEQEIWKLLMHFPRSCKGCEIHRALTSPREWELTGQDSSLPVMFLGNSLEIMERAR